MPRFSGFSGLVRLRRVLADAPKGLTQFGAAKTRAVPLGKIPAPPKGAPRRRLQREPLLRHRGPKGRITVGGSYLDSIAIASPAPFPIRVLIGELLRRNEQVDYDPNGGKVPAPQSGQQVDVVVQSHSPALCLDVGLRDRAESPDDAYKASIIQSVGLRYELVPEEVIIRDRDTFERYMDELLGSSFGVNNANPMLSPAASSALLSAYSYLFGYGYYGAMAAQIGIGLGLDPLMAMDAGANVLALPGGASFYGQMAQQNGSLFPGAPNTQGVNHLGGMNTLQIDQYLGLSDVVQP